MDPAQPVPTESTTMCWLLRVILYTKTSRALFGQSCHHNIKCHYQWSGEIDPSSNVEEEFTQRISCQVYGGDIQGIIHYELLGNNQTINTDLQYQQLCCLKAASDRICPSLINRKAVILHHNKARLTDDCMTDFEEFDWEKVTSSSIFSWLYHFWLSLV